MNILARLVLILAFLSPSLAASETLRGLVVGFNDVSVEIMVEGPLLPVPGDRATILSESIDGDLTTVGVWRIERLEGDRIHASPEGSVGEVWPGQVAEIDSPAPQKRVAIADPWFESLLSEAEAIGPPIPAPEIGEPIEGAETTTDSDPEVQTGDDPQRIDPANPQVAPLIREWIATARPPENAVEGNNVRYSGKGNIIGTVVGGIIESRHETGDVDPVFLWTNRRLLDSVDHCTMEEFVVARLKNESVGHCAGRYGAVKDLKGLRLADAKAAVTGAGFAYSLAPGSAAKTPEDEGRVEKQEPGPEHFLRKGQSIRLTIHAPHVPKTVPLPDFMGKPLAEARKWIEQNGLKSSLQPGSPAPAASLSGTVEKQDPAAKTGMTKGSTVTLTIHSAYVDLGSVPDIHGLAHDVASSKLEQAGLVMDRRDAGRPAESRLANTVQKQDPAPGTSITKGSAVAVWVYGQYTSSREERVAATDCSHYPGSRAYWDETAGGPRCGCFDGLVWNLATSHCVTADVRANEVCARDMPGTSARGRTAEGKINCVCPDGQFWNVSQRRCERQLTPQEICDRDMPGTTARGKTPEGKINCVCPDGQFWSASQRRCERQLSPREICEQHYPGSVPTGKDASGRVNCDCPQGYGWADNPRRCIKGDSSRCEEYARTVVAQYQQNLANRCGFTGARWSDDYQGHYGWCLTNSQALADSETQARANELNRCIRDASRCEHYARTAVAQFQQNLANRCGFTGARWSSDYQGHYGWCLTNSQAGAASETQARTEGLDRCIASPPPVQPNCTLDIGKMHGPSKWCGSHLQCHDAECKVITLHIINEDEIQRGLSIPPSWLPGNFNTCDTLLTDARNRGCR